MTQTHVSMGVAKTVLEVADVAWTAVERCQHHRHHHVTEPLYPGSEGKAYSDMESLRSENQPLRLLLETNLTLVQQMSASPVTGMPFRYSDLEKVGVLITVDQEEPSWWVWVSEDMVSTNAEEKSGIDNENYIVVGEEHVVDGVANFMARCIVANPKALNLTPQELLKALTKALGDINKVEKMLNIWHAGKMFYTMATWGLTLASLYQGRAILRLAAVGVRHSSKLALKALSKEPGNTLSLSNTCNCRSNFSTNHLQISMFLLVNRQDDEFLLVRRNDKLYIIIDILQKYMFYILNHPVFV